MDQFNSTVYSPRNAMRLILALCLAWSLRSTSFLRVGTDHHSAPNLLAVAVLAVYLHVLYVACMHVPRDPVKPVGDVEDVDGVDDARPSPSVLPLCADGGP